MVSICIQAYNHEGYIEKCLDSILNQKTTFDFEILLGEDDSKDSTRAICEKYALRYPDKIQLFLHERKDVIKINGRPTGRYNLLNNLNNAKGKYITICDGDDYWIDDYKLQKQVDFFEEHESYVLCFHKAKVYDEHTETYIEDSITKNVPPTTTINDLAIANYIHTVTCMFRRSALTIPEWYKKVPFGDYPLWCIIAKKGKIFKIEEECAVYRVHTGGAMSDIKKMDVLDKARFHSSMAFMYQQLKLYSGVSTFEQSEVKHRLMERLFHVSAGNSKGVRKVVLSLLKKITFMSFSQVITVAFSYVFPLRKRADITRFLEQNNHI